MGVSSMNEESPGGWNSGCHWTATQNLSVGVCQPRTQYRRFDGIRSQRAQRATIANVRAVMATA